MDDKNLWKSPNLQVALAPSLLFALAANVGLDFLHLQVELQHVLDGLATIVERQGEILEVVKGDRLVLARLANNPAQQLPREVICHDTVVSAFEIVEPGVGL